MAQVRKENSFWMATGAPAWALMRCGEGAGAKQAGELRGWGGRRGEADPRRLQESSLTSQNSWVSCSTSGSVELRRPSSRAERVSFL